MSLLRVFVEHVCYGNGFGGELWVCGDWYAYVRRAGPCVMIRSVA